jgi:hypothetical protein
MAKRAATPSGKTAPQPKTRIPRLALPEEYETFSIKVTKRQRKLLTDYGIYLGFPTGTTEGRMQADNHIVAHTIELLLAEDDAFRRWLKTQNPDNPDANAGGK